MRKLSLLFFVLCLAPSVHAALSISVNGVIHPPLDEVLLQPDETTILGIHGDGFTPPNIAAYLLVEGSASIDGYTMIYPGSFASYEDFPIPFSTGCVDCGPPEHDLNLIREFSGKANVMDFSAIILADLALPAAPLDGLLVDNIILHCGAIGYVRLSLVSDDFTILYDTQDIHQIPEPVTLLLLGLGGLILAREARRCA